VSNGGKIVTDALARMWKEAVLV